MDTDDLIDSYVRDVIRHLPRRQRADVGFELRSMLIDELAERAGNAGRPADEAMAIELLRGFGPPREVADRYRPRGFTVIRPSEAPRFAAVALGGVLVQWGITLPAAFSASIGPETLSPAADSWLTRLSTWWLSWGLGAFWWPGFLISLTIIGAALAERRGEDGAWSPQTHQASGATARRWRRSRAREVDSSRVSRPWLVVWMAAGVLGASLVIALPWLATLAPGLPKPVLSAFAMDADFLRWRAPWALLLWVGTFVLYLRVLVAGRWAPETRRIGVALSAAWTGLMLWWVMAGPVFTTTDADGTTKFALSALAIICAVDVVVTIRRTSPIRPPAL